VAAGKLQPDIGRQRQAVQSGEYATDVTAQVQMQGPDAAVQEAQAVV